MLVGPSFEVGVTTHSSLLDEEVLARAIQEYNSERTGILTNVGGDVAGEQYSLGQILYRPLARTTHAENGY